MWEVILCCIKPYSCDYHSYLDNDMLTLPLLLKSINKDSYFLRLFAGLVWCIGYIGYNFFKGDEDPDWAAIEARFRNKHSDTTNEDLLKEREV